MRFWILALLISLTASAAPVVRPKNGESVRLLLGDKRERGFGVRPARGEWKLDLGHTDADLAEIVDVTAQVAMKWQVAVVDGTVRLEADRFVADHAYRVELRRGPKTLGQALIYLYPAKLAARQQLKFDDDDSGSDELTTVPKPTL